MTSTRPISFWQKARIILSVIFHRRTPFSAKALLGFALVYGIMPIDVIPDFFPILGKIDDVALIFGAVFFFLHVTKALRADMERKANIIDVPPL